MQLKPATGHIAQALGALAAGLLAAGGAHAQSAGDSYPTDSYAGDAASKPSSADAAVLIYQEQGGRVRAIEPSANLTLRSDDDAVLSFGFVADSLTGASANGAVPSDQPQTFITPLILQDSTMTVTTASGGSTVVSVPPSPGQVANAQLYGRQYTTPANTLPLDPGFHDQRFAGSIDYSQPFGSNTRGGIGASYSSEHDYRAITGHLTLSQDLNAHNTTLSAAANFEYDTSSPYGGTPTPFTQMSAQLKGPDDNRKVVDLMVGVTQAVTRNWLVQLNYSYGTLSGYQNDPYRILSVVDAVSGEPLQSLYENRPRSRKRQSLYFGNKVDIGRQVFDVSGRYFWDDWGIRSETVEASDRIALTHAIHVTPHVRWYRQGAANFYQAYLVNGQPLPQYASSDIRLGKFTATTFGATVGFKLWSAGEFYVRGEYYRQSGDHHPAGAIGQLAHQDLFSGVSATSVMIGYSLGF